MWTYTAYILQKYVERTGSNELQFADLSKFVWDDLWKGQKLTFWDGDEELYSDLDYLAKLQLLKLENNEGVIKIKDKEEGYVIRTDKPDTLMNVRILITDEINLGQTALIVIASSSTNELFRRYQERIDRAFEGFTPQKERAKVLG